MQFIKEPVALEGAPIEAPEQPAGQMAQFP
jgi:hypothetical protein